MTEPVEDFEDRLQVATLVALTSQSIAALADSPHGPFDLHPCAGPADWLQREWPAGCHALILPAGSGSGSGKGTAEALAQAGADTAVLLVATDPLERDRVQDWLRRGAQDVLLRHELAARSFPLRVRVAVERQRREQRLRTAYATDVGTGLPHQQQFIEHASQLLALRQREPGPLAVLVVRVEGIAKAEGRFGTEAANALRRKIAVRLRAGVRTSDVVAALGDDRFGVLLGSLLAPADAGRVGAKLVNLLQAPFPLAGEEWVVAAALGVAQPPDDGTDAEALLRRAASLAAAATAQGRFGFANYGEAGGPAQGAANDD